jgi:2-dehydropantoate 2-reductase
VFSRWGAKGKRTECQFSLSTQDPQAKLAKGLQLTDYQNNETQASQFNFVDPKLLMLTSESNFIADFLWLTVKCTGVERAAGDIFPLVGPDTVILCCQNGLGSDKIIRQLYPDNLILRVMVPFNVVELSDGHFHRGSEGNLKNRWENRWGQSRMALT